MTNYDKVDADSHVVEGEGTWETYLEERYADRRPQAIRYPRALAGRPKRTHTWLVDGSLQPCFDGPGGVTMSTPVDMDFSRQRGVPTDIQALRDPAARVELMKQLGVRRTVMYSTFFLQPPTIDVAFEAALMRAWNNWMADRCAQHRDALRFAAVVPFRDVGLAIAEVRRARVELGADAVMVLAGSGEHMLHAGHIDPFWAEVQDLDMAVAIHFGWPNDRIRRTWTALSSTYLCADAWLWWAYTSVFGGGITDRFPRLRISFLEHDSRWLDMFFRRARFWYEASGIQPWPTKKPPDVVLQEHPIFFTLEGDAEYLPELMRIVGEDRVMAASDIPHTHYVGGRMNTTMDVVEAMSSVTPLQKRKVMHDNACRYYGWDDV